MKISFQLRMVIQEIANIQLAALEEASNYSGYEPEHLHFLKSIIGARHYIREAIQAREDQWKEIHENPSAIFGINSYDLGMCTHILFIMESEFINDKGWVDGVLECWDMFDLIYEKNHPEVKRLLNSVWKRKNLSDTSKI